MNRGKWYFVYTHRDTFGGVLRLYNSPPIYTRIVNGEKISFKVLIFTPDGELLNLKYPDLINDPKVVVNPKSYSDSTKDRLKNELIDKLQDYQSRKPFYNK